MSTTVKLQTAITKSGFSEVILMRKNGQMDGRRFQKLVLAEWVL